MDFEKVKSAAPRMATKYSEISFSDTVIMRLAEQLLGNIGVAKGVDADVWYRQYNTKEGTQITEYRSKESAVMAIQDALSK